MWYNEYGDNMLEKLNNIMSNYVNDRVTDYRIIDSSVSDDYRVNYIINNKYVLRVNNDVITEKRLSEIDRLQQRYNEAGIRAPALYRNNDGNYLTSWNEHVCYLSEYIDELTLDQLDDKDEILKEVLSSNASFAQRYRNVDLIDTRSMWSAIRLAPLDVDIDEKQENLNRLVSALKDSNEKLLADEITELNEKIRKVIADNLDSLPQCVIQGDLNETNILIKDGHFYGLIDFNMAGTEVIINQLCSETTVFPDEQEFDELSAEELYRKVNCEQDQYLALMLKEYELNDLEKEIIPYYRTLCMIAQYPNVCAYIEYLRRNHEKLCSYLRIMITERKNHEMENSR